MTRMIDQFMWAFQDSFRTSIEYEIQETLSHIGLQTHDEAKVLLIGLATKEGLPHAICIEPEDGPLVVDDLRSVAQRTDEILEADPESGVIHTHPRVHEHRTRGLFLRSRARAIAEAIQESGKFEGLSFFVSYSARVAGYDIHTCLGIPCDALASAPRFNNPKKDDYHGRHIEDSFVQAIINTSLHLTDRALYLPDPGEGFIVLGDRSDIVRGSAKRFVEGVTYALTPQPSDLFSLASEFSSLTYERSSAKGHLIITSRDNLENKLKVTFANPVPLHDTRSVRKILELTDEARALLTDGRAIYGLGECLPAPNVAEIAIEGHAKWSLIINGTALMKVAYEHATLPKQILDKDLFRDVAHREVGAVEVERVWDILQCALDNNHGTTIVVSENPVSEIERLGQEALAIKPEYLDHRDVARLGRIDGAIILGPEGRCYAFGVILDGLATTSSDRARGARFNSSIRYQRTSKIGTMVIVISDDGTVDLIPNLMPRVWRQEVEDTVRAFCEYSGVEGNDGEEWARRDRAVERLAFYLNQEQCDRVNEAYEKEMASRLEGGGVSLTRERLQPDPESLYDTYEDELERRSNSAHMARAIQVSLVAGSSS